MKWTESRNIHGASSCKFTLAEGASSSRMRVTPQGDGCYGWSIRLHIPGTLTHYRASGTGAATETKARHMAMTAVSLFLQAHDGVRPNEDA